MTTKTTPTRPKKTTTPAVAPVLTTAERIRKLKPASPFAFRFRKRVSQPKRIMSAWTMTRNVGELLWQNKQVFIGLALVYGVLNLILVRGFSGGTDVSHLKHELGQVFHGNFGPLASSLTVLTTLIATSGNTSSSTGGAYQIFLLLIVSLATIWSLRMLMAGDTVRLKTAFYQGMYPLVPFLLVLIVISLQLLPMLAGAGIYSIAVSNGVASDIGEQLLWGLLFAVLAALSLYMLCSSLFALYIVTLPNMTPRKALRSARELVRYRRLAIIRKLLFLPLVLIVAAVVIMLPVILFVPVVAQWLFFFLTMLGLVVTHSYMYSLYRELLK